MADLATRLRTTGDRLIGKYGRAASLLRYTDVRTPGASTTVPTPTTYSIKLVESDFKEAQIPEALIVAGDRAYIVSALGLAVEPKSGDTVVDGAEKPRVVHVSRVKPGATTILYGILARA
jgi:hypothetical protein